MSTLEAAREILCQVAETPPGEVLKAAREEVVRLTHMVENAKNVLQRKGARKKLSELEPLLPAMEIEVGLVQLEKSLEDVKSAGQRAAARVQAQKLAAQITALPSGEEKEFFQQWLGDMNPSLASTQPGSAMVELAAVPPPLAPPAIALPKVAPPPLPTAPPAPDPAVEIHTALASLEAQLKTQPISDPPKISREIEALTARCAALPPNETRAQLEQSIISVTRGLKLLEEVKDVGEAVGALEQSATRPDVDLSTLSTEHDQIASRIARLSARPEYIPLQQKLGGINVVLDARRETKSVEMELGACADQIQKDPTQKTTDGSLAALAARIGRLQDSNARTALSQRVELLRASAAHRREEIRVSEAMAEMKQKCRAPNALLSPLRSSFEAMAKDVERLPVGPVRSDLEKQLHECRDLVGALGEKQPAKARQNAAVLQLDPIIGRSAPAARSVVFVARERFSIGRKPENEPPRADLLTPSAELRISRVHVTFVVHQRQIHVLAGEEGKPSTNPATIDQTPLTATPLAISFDHERRIDLTGVFALNAKLLPSTTPYGPPFDQDESPSHNTTVMVPAIGGALRVRPHGEDKLPMVAVWLFTDATIGSSSECAITLPQSGMAPELARIHFWKKSFWIEVLRSGSLVQLAGKSLNPGASQPLLSGQELRLGNFVYKVQVA